MLHAAEPCWPDWVAEQQQRLDGLRRATAEWPDEERLAARLAFLGELTDQFQKRLADLPEATRTAHQR
jgi:hypothetical protein